MATPKKPTGRIIERGEKPEAESEKPTPKASETEKPKGKKGRKLVDENETREDRFVRLATGRANQAVYHIQNLANLANRAQYNYSESQVEKVFDFLRASIDKSEAAFAKTFKHRDKLTL